jgi:hypothetical protein
MHPEEKETKKLKPGEEPERPHCINWREVARTLGAVRPQYPKTPHPKPQNPGSVE